MWLFRWVRTFVLMVVLFFGTVYYVRDGDVNFISTNEQIHNMSELKFFVEKELDVAVQERPDELRVDYVGSDFGLDVNEMKKILSAGNYNTLSIGGFVAKGEPIVFNRKYTTTSIQLSYRDSLDDERYIDEKINQVLDDIITDGMSEYEQVEAINHYISHHTTYYEDLEHHGQSVRVLLEDGTGVCTAYALTTARMLDALGFENMIVGGDGHGSNGWIPHAWNMVVVDNEWYNLDVTWNHPRKTSGLHNEYRYFLVSDGFIEDTHRPMADELPVAKNTQYENQYLNDYSGIEQ